MSATAPNQSSIRAVTDAELSPASVAVAHASVKVSDAPGEVSVGALRVRVLQVADLPGQSVENGQSSSWLRYSTRNSKQGGNSKPKMETMPSIICVLLKTSTQTTPVFATESKPYAESIVWNEEFYVEQVKHSDELQLYCVDRAKNEPYSRLPLRVDASTCPGFIGKVCIPLQRLPEAEEIEQWYPLIPKESYLSLRTALRISLCFFIGKDKAVTSKMESSRHNRPLPASLPLSSRTEISAPSPVESRLCAPVHQSPGTDSQTPVALPTGVIDYVIIVGPPTLDSYGAAQNQENIMLFRYPAVDRDQFPLPTKIEWFCFPGGPEIVIQAERPTSKMFSFILVGGDDGLCRCYVVCLIVYHRRRGGDSNIWYGTCFAFLTRIPLIDQASACLLGVAHAWLESAMGDTNKKGVPEKYLVDLCDRILVPIRGVLGVRFSIEKLEVSLVLPTGISIYNNGNMNRGILQQRYSPIKSPSSSFTRFQHGFQPLVYSLEPLFRMFDVKTIIHIVALILSEYRILIHSSQLSLLCPVAEGLCALIYPFRWQHPYVPILPRVLSEYLQAPLPYILGVHSSWLPELLDNGRPDHLVVIDVDRGAIHVQDTLGPLLPLSLTKGLHNRVQKILYRRVYDDACIPREEMESWPEDSHHMLEWNDHVEKQIRLEFVCFLSSILIGYRGCLLFVNRKLPVFNKRRFFATSTGDSEATPFLMRLFSTQAFQAFLENHSSIELSVFHSVYLTFCRTKTLDWPNSLPSLSIINQPSFRSFRTTDMANNRDHSSEKYIPTALVTPVYTMPRPRDECVQTHPDPPIHEESQEANASDTIQSLGLKVETLLNELNERVDTPFSMDLDEVEASQRDTASPSIPSDIHQLAHELGVDPRIYEEHADMFLRAHEVNQHQIRQHAHNKEAGSLGMSNRHLSTEEERIEQILHKCLTSVFASDDMLSREDIQICELRFKHLYARELFVLILMQPSQQYVEMSSSNTGATSTGGSTWYNPKGSGSCIGESGFKMLARLSCTLMDQCAIHEDFTNARGMLQVALQYYHYVEDKQSGVGFAKKEYLVTPLRLRPICRSLDMWQHAFSREIEGALQADPMASDEGKPDTVGDELFFSVIGSLVYDMLSFEVPLSKVHTFVAVMCSTYQKGKDLLDILKQLVENVYRALDMSKDIKSSPPKNAIVKPTSTAPIVVKENPVMSRQYDLNNVIRRKMSAPDNQAPVQSSTSSKSEDVKKGQDNGANGHSFVPATNTPRRAVGSDFPCVILCNQTAPILSMSIYEDRVACGLIDSHVCVMDAPFSEKHVRLDGHSDAVVAVHLQRDVLVSGSRDFTLRAWDLRVTTKKRHIFSFFGSSSNTMEVNGESTRKLDGPSISRTCRILKGHTAAITCVEIGQQLATGRAIIGSGSEDGTVRLWDSTRETSVALLGNGKGGVRCLRFLPLYDLLVSGCRQHTLKVWDLAVSKLKFNITQAHEGCIRDIQITGDRLVTAGNDRVVKVWDAHFRSGQQYVHALHKHCGPVECVSLGGPADPNICTGAADGVICVWDLRYVNKGPRLTLTGHVGQVTSLQRDFTRLVSGSEDGSLRVWDMQSGVCLKDVKAHVSGITAVMLQDSNVYTASWDGSVRLWDIEGANASSPTR